ncbi:MAG: hypothetical protein K2Z81_09760, partial [Cyanobacteria bacterium]|nr:hypothetical protein [Cyanobacteriota bacterium]
MTDELKEMERLSLWCLRKDPGDRPQSMGEIMDVLSGKASAGETRRATKSMRSSQKNAAVGGSTSMHTRTNLRKAEPEKTVELPARVPFYADRIVILALFGLIGFISLVGGVVLIATSNRSAPPLYGPSSGAAYSTAYNTAASFPINGTQAEQFEWGLKHTPRQETKVEFPEGYGANPEMRLLGVYGGDPFPDQTFKDGWKGRVDVMVDKSKQPLILVLDAYMPVEWHIRTATNVTIKKIIAVGMRQPKVVGAPAGIPIEYVYGLTDSGETRSPKDNAFAPFYFDYDPSEDLVQTSEFTSSREVLEKYTKCKLASFRGIYITKQFQIE